MLKPSSYTEETDIEFLEGYIFDYLEKNMHKGNILAISGKWGGGKTYFWKHGIKNRLDEKEYKHLYISLYGIDSVEKIEDMIAEKIIIDNEIKKNIIDIVKIPTQIGQDLIKKLFGVDSEKYINIAAKSNIKKILKKENIFLCFDDLERKSSLLSINDFFGFIANLRDEYDLPITIIYNEIHIQNEDQDIYASTKEKLIDKYIIFNPSVGSLFSIILKKYEDYENYKYIKKLEEKITENILEPLNFINARTYDKFLMNIFEWLNKYPDLKDWTFIKSIILSTISFVHKNTTLDFAKNKTIVSNDEKTGVKYIEILFIELKKYFIDEQVAVIHNTCINSKKSHDSEETFLNMLNKKFSNSENVRKIEFSIRNKNILQAIYLYGYYCDYGNEIDVKNNKKINCFIQTGILV